MSDDMIEDYVREEMQAIVEKTKDVYFQEGYNEGWADAVESFTRYGRFCRPDTPSDPLEAGLSSSETSEPPTKADLGSQMALRAAQIARRRVGEALDLPKPKSP